MASPSIIPLGFHDTWIPINTIRNVVFITLPARLDESLLKTSLETLIRVHLPVLGARILSQKLSGEKRASYAYHLPGDKPIPGYQLYGWSSTTREGSIYDADVIPKIPTGERVVFSDLTPGDMRRSFLPSTWPTDHKSSARYTPILLVHLVKYADATVLVTSLPHLVADQMGYGALFRAWMDIAAGRKPPEFINLLPSHWPIPEKDIRKSASMPGLNPPRRIQLDLYKAFLLPCIGSPREVNCPLFIPVFVVQDLLSKVNRQLQEQHSDPNIAVTKGDIVMAVTSKFMMYQYKKPRPTITTFPVNLRGRHPLLPAGREYLHNATVFATAQGHTGRFTPLADLALRTRKSIAEATGTTEAMTARLRWLESHYDRGFIAIPGVAGHIMLSFTNWCNAWHGMSFAPAMVREPATHDVEPSANVLAPDEVLIWGRARMVSWPCRFAAQIMSKTSRGYWVDFHATPANYKELKQLLQDDPSLYSLL